MDLPSVVIDTNVIISALRSRKGASFKLIKLIGQGQFTINILDQNQEDLSSYFAKMWNETDPPPFTFEPWVCGPRLEGAIGGLACRVDQVLEGGDHWIVTGLVVDLYQTEGAADPLLYFGGRYRKLAEMEGS